MPRTKLQCARLGLLAVTVASAAATAVAAAAGNPPVTHVRPVGRTNFTVTIRTSTMEPTVHCARHAAGDGCLAAHSDKLSVRRLRTAPHEGDIVLVQTPRSACRAPAGRKYVRRVIGLPGDTIEERLVGGEGYLFRNGWMLDERYVMPARRDGRTFAKTTVPKGEYFLLGDNRLRSCDSRDWGAVRRSAVLGTVVRIIRYG